MNKTKQYYVYYSPKAAKIYGSSIYLTTDGKEVEGTLLCLKDEESKYFWDDKQFVGPVSKYLRRGEVGVHDNRE